MVHSNKVLTVSYGTFSCTLEGFEDSFDTMKAIAEYFRDLAADDRYFGAEPPQPDTEMLARIAEREIARQVEARREGSGFVLRAARPEAPAALAAATARAAEQAPTEEPAGTPGEQAAEEQEAEQQAKAQPAAAEAAVEPAPDVEPEPEVETEPKVETAAAEDSVAAFMAQATEVEAEPEIEAFEPEIEAFTPEAEPIAPSVAPAADSIAAKLQRIRAVVSRNEMAAQEADYVEDQHSEDAFAPAEEPPAPTPEAAEADEAPAEQDRDDAPVDSEAEAAARIAAEVDAAEARRAARLRRRKARAEQAAEDEKAAEAEAALQIEAAIRAEPEAQPVTTAEADAVGEETPEDDTLFADLDRTDAPEDGEDRLNILAQMAEDKREGRARSRRGRVVMVKRDQLEEEAEATDATARPQADAAPRQAVPSVELPPSTLSPEDEAELMRELAEVEAELRGDERAEAPEAVAETRRETPAAEADGSDLSRLMAAADEKLDAPEAATTREAYSHLRAAVAATQAERSAGGTVSAHPDADAYRADLARVVQPRRPQPAVGRRARRAAQDDARPAPLKLVAEQRVDDIAEKAARTGPVRPRRIATEEPAPKTTGESFAAFAEEMGAQDLPELLEAAAAYMQFVEGRTQFTRPQLIHKAREAADEEFSREDGLRSFGRLLREGKIVKQDSGRFVASGEIGFQPASRAAG